YVQLYEQWGEDEDISDLKEQLIASLDQQLIEGDDEHLNQLPKTLAYLLKDSQVRSEIGLRYENLLENAIKREETDLLENYWTLMLVFQEEDERVNGKFSDLALQNTLKSIFGDDSSLTKTNAFIDFYLIAEEKDEDSR